MHEFHFISEKYSITIKKKSLFNASLKDFPKNIHVRPRHDNIRWKKENKVETTAQHQMRESRGGEFLSIPKSLYSLCEQIH